MFQPTFRENTLRSINSWWTKFKSYACIRIYVLCDYTGCQKLDARSRKGIFVGYDKGNSANPETNKVEKVRYVKIFDNFQVEQNDVDLISKRAQDEKID